MEKILTIDGKQVHFRSTGAFLLRYKAQFGRDAMQDLFKLQQALSPDGQTVDVGALDLEVFYNLVWTLAKVADPTIPPPLEWLDSFGEFPIIDIIPEVVEMIFSSITSTAKKKEPHQKVPLPPSLRLS